MTPLAFDVWDNAQLIILGALALTVLLAGLPGRGYLARLGEAARIGGIGAGIGGGYLLFAILTAP